MPRIPLVLNAVVLLSVAGCAMAGSSDGSERRDTIAISGMEGERYIFIDRYAIQSGGEYTLDARPIDVLAALPAAYRMLGIPAPDVDRGALRAESRGFAVTRRLGQERVTRYIRCVSDAFGRSAAEGDRIVFSVSTTVSDNGQEGAAIRTAVTAVPQGSAASSVQTPCTSNGVLEQAIKQAVELQLVQ